MNSHQGKSKVAVRLVVLCADICLGRQFRINRVGKRVADPTELLKYKTEHAFANKSIAPGALGEGVEETLNAEC